MTCFFAVCCLAAEVQPDKQNSPTVESEKITSSVNNKKQKKSAPHPGWPRPYSSSEEISADSIVDFPADI
jgi:hypothetical protein